MKRNVVLYFVALAALLIMLPACGSLNKVTPESLDDEAIELEIRTNLADDIELKAFEIGVEVSSDGVVTLDGTVDNDAQRQKAVEVARNVKGVTRVINSLRVKS